MTDRFVVFVNGARTDVPSPATVLDAVRTWNPDAASDVQAGARSLTDSRGLPLPSDAPLYAGAIVRVVPVRERSGPDDGDLLH